MFDTNSAEFCRAQADEMRAQAEQSDLPNVRARLLQAAASWDRNAAFALRVQQRADRR